MRFPFISMLAIATFAIGLGAAAAQPQEVAPPPKVAALFPTLPDADAWAKLPPPKEPRLAEWACVLAGPLPKTTAKMLELDYLQREENPLGLLMSAHIRGVVASSLESRYGVALARSDWHRALEAGKPQPGSEELALVAEFAKKLTLEGHAITDEEFADVLKHFGPEKTTAIVHTVAYANFHNRILLGLGVKGESLPLPPLAIKFDTEAVKAAPSRPPWDDLKAVKAGGLAIRANWSEGDASAMAKKLESQKERTLRIPLPDKSAYAKLTPREQESSQRIRWNTVSMGYQPEMTRAWFAALYAFYDESKPDRVFTNSAFWVVTRTNDCFY